MLQLGLEKDGPQETEAPSPRGKQNIGFDHYRLVTHSDGSAYELGRGGMGVTYKAFDTNLHSYVAIKTVYPPLLQNKKLRERFEREARQAAQFRHPNVASIYYLNTTAEHCFYAMELVEGESVEQLVERSGPVAAHFATEICAQIIDALAAAETLRLVHRDIKPSNLMLTRAEDGTTRVKIIDFGIALWVNPQTSRDAEQLTQAGLIGTAHFASPEQLRHDPVDSRSDIYSLGATLWFMVMGRPPFLGRPEKSLTSNCTRRRRWTTSRAFHAACLSYSPTCVQKTPLTGRRMRPLCAPNLTNAGRSWHALRRASDIPQAAKRDTDTGGIACCSAGAACLGVALRAPRLA